MPILYPEPGNEDFSVVARGSSSLIALLVVLRGFVDISEVWIIEGLAEKSALQDALDDHLGLE